MAPLSIQEEMLKPREVLEKKNEKNKNRYRKSRLAIEEMKIARSLAGNNETIRKRALKSVKYWLHHCAGDSTLTKDNYMKLWAGLFYSMWMSDKPLIQEECAENISNLIHELPLENSLVFFECGLVTLINEWFGIDQLRLDKFMMFVRRLLRQALCVLKTKSNFKRSDIIKFGNILSSTVLDPAKKDAGGIFMHFTEIYMEELAKVTEGNLNPDLITDFVTPFVKCLSITDDNRRINHIKRHIFMHLMFQSDAGMEYQQKYDIWKKMGFKGSINQIQRVEDEEAASMFDLDSTNEETASSMKDKPLDPRAGRVDVELPQLVFRPKAISKLLLKNKFTKGSTVASRKVMNALSDQFAKLAQGSYPLGITKLKLPNDDDDLSIRKAVNRLVKFDKKITGQDSRTLRRKSEDSRKNEPSVSKDSVTKTDKNVTKKRRSGNEDAKNEAPSKKRVKYPESPGCKPLITNSGLWLVSDQVPEVSDDKGSKQKPKQSSKTDFVQSTVADDLNISDLQSPEKTEATSIVCAETESTSNLPNDKTSTSEKEDTVKLPKATSKVLFLKQQWDDSSSEREEYEICVPSNIESSNLHKNDKCVKFNKNLTKIQQFHEYHSQVSNSHIIPFDANKQPGKSILKKSAINTPSDPFYRKFDTRKQLS